MKPVLISLSFLVVVGCAKSGGAVPDASPSAHPGTASTASADTSATKSTLGLGTTIPAPEKGATDKGTKIGTDADRVARPAGVGAARGKPTTEVTDDTIDQRTTIHVQQAIQADKGTSKDAGAVRVTTVAGAVTLSGFVSTAAIKDRVTIVAKAVGGVARVDNQIVVDPEAVKTQRPTEGFVDRIISDRVRLALLDDRSIAPEVPSVTIFTQDGVVQLSGTVSTESVKSRITVIASAVGSVQRVVNDLAVSAK